MRLSTLSIAVATLMISSACTQGTVTPGPVLACDTGTGGAQPTEGGDHGLPWVPPGQSSAADETSTPLFDVGGGFDLDGPPPPLTDPSAWEIDPSGVHYRRATQNEIAKNRWHEDVLLVALQSTVVNAVKNGTSTTTLHLPLVDPPGWPQEDLAILTVGISLRGSDNYTTFTEKRQNQNGTVTTTRSRPTYRYYQHRASSGTTSPTMSCSCSVARVAAWCSMARRWIERSGSTGPTRVATA